jgi:hypothetical protein
MLLGELNTEDIMKTNVFICINNSSSESVPGVQGTVTTRYTAFEAQLELELDSR